MRKRKFILTWLNRILFIVTIVSGLGSLIPANILRGSGFLALLFPLLFVPHGLMLFITIRIAPKRIIPNIIGMALTFIPAMAQFPFAQSIQTPESPVRVASYNVRAFYQGEDAASNIGLWAVKEAIDVLCAQEIRNPGFEHIKSQFTYTTLDDDANKFSVGIFSNYPIIHHEQLIFSSLEEEGYPKRSAAFADITLPWDTIRFINVHLNSTGVKGKDMDVEPDRESIISHGKAIIRKLGKSDFVRGVQSDHILDWVRESPHPVVLSGDFNGVPSGYLYLRLLQSLEDPYIWKGTGKMGSFEPLKRRWLPFKIDWTLHSPEISSSNQFIDHVPYSDHYPLVTVLSSKE